MSVDQHLALAAARRDHETTLRAKQRRIDQLENHLLLTRQQLRNTEAARDRLHRRVLELEGVEPVHLNQKD